MSHAHTCIIVLDDLISCETQAKNLAKRSRTESRKRKNWRRSAKKMKNIPTQVRTPYFCYIQSYISKKTRKWERRWITKKVLGGYQMKVLAWVSSESRILAKNSAVLFKYDTLHLIVIIHPAHDSFCTRVGVNIWVHRVHTQVISQRWVQWKRLQ